MSYRCYAGLLTPSPPPFGFALEVTDSPIARPQRVLSPDLARPATLGESICGGQATDAVAAGRCLDAVDWYCAGPPRTINFARLRANRPPWKHRHWRLPNGARVEALSSIDESDMTVPMPASTRTPTTSGASWAGAGGENPCKSTSARCPPGIIRGRLSNASTIARPCRSAIETLRRRRWLLGDVGHRRMTPARIFPVVMVMTGVSPPRAESHFTDVNRAFTADKLPGHDTRYRSRSQAVPPFVCNW